MTQQANNTAIYKPTVTENMVADATALATKIHNHVHTPTLRAELEAGISATESFVAGGSRYTVDGPDVVCTHKDTGEEIQRTAWADVPEAMLRGLLITKAVVRSGRGSSMGTI